MDAIDDLVQILHGVFLEKDGSQYLPGCARIGDGDAVSPGSSISRAKAAITPLTWSTTRWASFRFLCSSLKNVRGRRLRLRALSGPVTTPVTGTGRARLRHLRMAQAPCAPFRIQKAVDVIAGGHRSRKNRPLSLSSARRIAPHVYEASHRLCFHGHAERQSDVFEARLSHTSRARPAINSELQWAAGRSMPARLDMSTVAAFIMPPGRWSSRFGPAAPQSDAPSDMAPRTAPSAYSLL